MTKRDLFYICQHLRKFVNQIIVVFTLAAFTLFSNSKIIAQAVQEDTIQSRFDTYSQHQLQEKIFVHTDKSNYVTGEICWFKIYQVDGCFNRPINLSKVVYVEILDNNNKAVLQAKVGAQNGTGDGSFFLPVTLVTGSYKMRAYTNWMKNSGVDYFFEKKLVIINVENYQSQKPVVQTKNYTIDFFPEGGNLVNGITSKVGFHVINQFGKGEAAAGVLVNDKGDSITAFHTLKFGIGSFSFTPKAGTSYKAIVKLSGGEKQVKELPVAYNNGYVMQIENTSNQQIKIAVESNKINTAANVFLFIHTRNLVKIALRSTLINGKTVFLIDPLKLGEGISHFTLFNEDRQPLCERLFFKKPSKNLQISVTTDEVVYNFRSKININITTSVIDQKLIPANMSLAVYRIDSFNTVEEQNIINYLLLSSDLSGNIESPQYYFNENNDTAIVAADNLMLTQGWRRFKWEDIFFNKQPIFHFLPEINGHIVNGKITTLKQGLPLESINAYLSVIGSPGQFQSSTSDEAGRVKFEMKDFFSDGEGEIILQTDNQKDSLYRVDIDSPFFPVFSTKPILPFNFSSQKDAILKDHIAAQVQNTFLSNKLNKILLPLTDTGAFFKKPDNAYFLDNYVRFTTMEEILREYVTEVNVRKHNGNFFLIINDDVANRSYFSNAPLVLVDGVPIFNFNKLMNFDPLKIRKLEIIKTRYYLGGNSFDGIINFNTYKGNLADFEIDPHAIVLDYEGLKLQREFYVTDYSTEQQRLSRLPDFRNLLYWSPKVITDETGKTQTAFYSSDLPGKYAIVVQGICENGSAGSTLSFFEVK